MTPGPLVLGVGNPERGDDGIGPAVAARVEQDGRLAGATVRSAMQLTPELAVDVAAASVVVIVDARVGVAAGAVDWAEVEHRSLGGGPGPFSHHLDPAGLCHLAGVAFGRVPPAFVVGIGAAGFDAGAPLSGPALAAVPHAVERVIGLATGI
ncbi:MAG TPA: hydrogenase maturation protease [Acidimicrobiales bacterium]|nr:hydrogenase maturation protease [Acidimicrobiales bacterium]